MGARLSFVMYRRDGTRQRGLRLRFVGHPLGPKFDHRESEVSRVAVLRLVSGKGSLDASGVIRADIRGFKNA